MASAPDTQTLVRPEPDSVLRLATSDFPQEFRLRDSWLGRALERRFRVELDETAPLLVYTVFGKRHRSRRATKVLCTGEAWPLPPRADYDYSIGWQFRDDDRHLRVPVALWNLLRFPAVAAEPAPRDWEMWAARPHFCNFVYSNPEPPERRAFLRELARRRFVHSPGAVETNSSPIEGGGREVYDWWWRRKLDYLRQFRFTIAFESRSRPGYTSEKLVDALHAGTIPIYWGNPDVALDVDPSSFISAHDFPSYAELADYVVHLDDHRDAAGPLLAAPRPLRHDLDLVADAIAELFERARADDAASSRAWRAMRPVWLRLRGDGVRARTAWLRRQAGRSWSAGVRKL